MSMNVNTGEQGADSCEAVRRARELADISAGQHEEQSVRRFGSWRRWRRNIRKRRKS